MQNEVGGETGAGELPKQKRLSEVQMATIRKAAGEEGAGAREILKRYANFGIAEAGLKDAVKRPDTRGALGRKKGAGQKTRGVWGAKIEQVRDLIQAGPCISTGDIRRVTGFSKTSIRRALKQVLHMKPRRKIKTQKICEMNTTKRLAVRQPWRAEMEANLKFDPRRALRADVTVQLLVGGGQAPRLGGQRGNWF